jgi:hypothetical protein
MVGNNQQFSWFIITMRSVVVLMNLSPLYTMNFELNEWMDN